MLDNLSNYSIFLASNSPRRRELLFKLGLKFDVITVNGIDESFPQELQGEEIPLYIADKKAEAYKSFVKDNYLIITADTVVVCDGEVLGKPKNREEAVSMLKKLSGRTHSVMTGVCLLLSDRKITFATTTEVTFDVLGDDDIEFYIDNYRPYDKAGGYGIQEWIGCIGVREIKGSYFNVMGLPVQRLYRELQSI